MGKWQSECIATDVWIDDEGAGQPLIAKEHTETSTGDARTHLPIRMRIL